MNVLGSFFTLLCYPFLRGPRKKGMNRIYQQLTAKFCNDVRLVVQLLGLGMNAYYRNKHITIGGTSRNKTVVVVEVSRDRYNLISLSTLLLLCRIRSL